jgi:hypothetical protein
VTEEGPEHLGGWGPPWLSLAEEGRAHHDAASAIVGSAVHGWGGRAALAAELGVGRSDLSRLLRLYGTSELREAKDYGGWRLAHGRTRQLAEGLGLPPEQRERLLYHAAMSKHRALAARTAVREVAASGQPDGLVATVHGLYGGAEHTPRGGYQRTAEAVMTVLHACHPARHPAVFVELLLVLHQCLCVEDRADEAYYVARLAAAIADRGVGDRAGEVYRRYAVQSRCAQGVALHNLKLDRQALAAYQLAATLAGWRHGLPPGEWTPMVVRGRLLSAAARSSRHDAARLRGWRSGLVLDATTPERDRAEALADEAYARALVGTGTRRGAREAQAVMADHVDSLPPGALHAVHVLKTAGVVEAAGGDREAAAHHLARARSLAEVAGLTRELRTLEDRPEGSASGGILRPPAGP